MIEYISGKLVSNKSTEIVLETNGIAYNIKVSLNTAKKLPPVGMPATIKTYLHVRENGLQLYGFWEEAERELFLGLLSISGVGPKLALSLLSGLSVDEIQKAIYQQNVKVLSSISGIGKKTAQRLIVELKDKVEAPDMSEVSEPGTVTPEPLSEVEKEAVLALVKLGFVRGQALRAVDKVQREHGFTRSEEIIKQALQVI